MTSTQLKRAASHAVARLARYLRLNIDGMSPRQIAGLVAWRLRKGVER